MGDKPTNEQGRRLTTPEVSRRGLLQTIVAGAPVVGGVGLVNGAPLGLIGDGSQRQHATGPYTQAQKFAAVDGDPHDKFGGSAALDAAGTTALIGAFADDGATGDATGSAYVFTKANDTWTNQQKLTVEDGDAGDLFGAAVALDGPGTTALIGADSDDDPHGNLSGRVHVFMKADDTWTHQQELTAADGAAGDFFGRSVTLDAAGMTALVGASRADVSNGDSAGSAYLFTRAANTWAHQQTLTAATGDANAFFGRSVALDGPGTTALIGAPYTALSNGERAGSAAVFTKMDGTWTHRQTLTAAAGEPGADFGAAVALDGSGTTALIGADGASVSNNSETGSAYVFTKANDTWSHQQTLTAADGDAGDVFGRSVALASTGTIGFVGATYDEDPNGARAGSAYVFRQTGDEWTQRQRLAAADGTAGDQFGRSVALAGSGATALSGAITAPTPQGDRAGSAYVFTGDIGAEGVVGRFDSDADGEISPREAQEAIVALNNGEISPNEAQEIIVALNDQ
jgi:hypothetical protein